MSEMALAERAQARPRQTDHRTAPDGRTIFHWGGRDRKQDTDRLAEAIVGTIELFSDGDNIAQLGRDGALIPVNFDRFRQLIAERICGVRVVRDRNGWRRDYFSYEFLPPERPNFRNGGARPSPNAESPDNAVLDEIYRDGLSWRLPKVQR